MTEGSYVLGIDFGTESVRVGIFDREGTPWSSPEKLTERSRGAGRSVPARRGDEHRLHGRVGRLLASPGWFVSSEASFG